MNLLPELDTQEDQYTRVQATRDVRGACITEDGQPGSRLLGIVTSRDTDFLNDRLTPLSEVMTRCEAYECL